MEKPWIVGIGASAGGLEALEAFFREVPIDSGISYVVIQHLSPDFRSLMDELLARHTDVKIIRVDRPTTVQPNTIYLLTPKMTLTIRGSKLIPKEHDPNLHLRLAVDEFFISLAEEYGPKAIGVILSGTGCDGTRGCGAIKEHDGFVIVQKPSSCQFDGMPNSIIRHALHDICLTPAEMPQIILRYINRASDQGIDLPILEKEVDKLTKITNLLKTVEGLDFTEYRPSTIARRIEKRINLNHLKSVDDYIKQLTSDESELAQLHSELLIGVTRFFRDAEEFEFLKTNVIPQIVKNAQDGGGDTVRIWVAGCSTGEEAYSIGMLVLDYLERSKIYLNVKVFATDVDREAVNFAALGKYPESIAADVGEEFLEKFFLKKEASYEVRTKLRRAIIFSQHNVIQDPPFTRMNLISCRNMLIYFKPPLQIKTLALFHFGLAKNGTLFLGKSESLGQLRSEFEPLHQTHKFYSKIREVKLSLAESIGSRKQISTVGVNYTRQNGAKKTTPLPSTPETSLDEIYQFLLERHVPPCVLVDKDLELLHIFGDASRFLKFPAGKTTLNLMKILDKDLSIALSTATLRAKKIGKQVVFTNIASSYEEGKAYTLKVDPLRLNTATNSYDAFMIVFEDHDRIAKSAESQVESFDQNLHSREQIENLEEQLQSTKETLQATIEELETTNEELQSTNEELMSSNEELQSSNEELQSVNEELFTVNAEHQSKIEEISQVNRDVEFLLSSSNIATMFLDRNLKIRRFNKQMQAIVSVMEHDIGRPITDLTFAFENERIITQILSTSKSGSAQTIEIRGPGDSDYIVKAVPYDYESKNYNQVDERTGVVVSVIDSAHISEVRELKRLFGDTDKVTYSVSLGLRQIFKKVNQSISALKEATPIDDSTPRLSTILSDIEEKLVLASKMFSGLVEYSKLGNWDGVFHEFDVRQVIKRVIKGMEQQADSVDISISALPSRLHGDQDQFELVMQCLIDNALNEVSDTEKKVVVIDASKKGGLWEFCISNNASKRRHSYAERSLDHLENVDYLTEMEIHPSIGLACTKRIITRHGGRFWLESKEGQGTKAFFTIPENAEPKL